MNESIAVEKTVVKEGREEARFQLKRDRATGRTTLYIKLVLSLGSMCSNGRTGMSVFGGVECRKIAISGTGNPSILCNPAGKRFYFNTNLNENTPPYHDNTWPIVSCLTAPGIENGITFQFGSAPMPASRWKEYVGDLRECVQLLYEQFYRPLDHEVVITTAERQTVGE